MLMCIIGMYNLGLVAYQVRFLFLLQEVDPCEDLTDDDILTAIQNAMGPKSALFVQEVTSKD